MESLWAKCARQNAQTADMFPPPQESLGFGDWVVELAGLEPVSSILLTCHGSANNSGLLAARSLGYTSLATSHWRLLCRPTPSRA